MLRRKRFYVIYPEYFDKDLSRSEGRRISIAKAAEEPTLSKLIFACKKLNIDFQEEPDKAFPARWYEKKGRLLIPIDKKDKKPKSVILEDMSDIVRRLVKKKKLVKQKSKDKNNRYAGKTPPVR